MSVQLILDYFGIDTKDALHVEATEFSINAVNKRVRQSLREQSPTLYRVRLSNEALYHRFEYLEGMDGVLQTHALIQSLLLAEKLNTVIPDWLTNELCVTLDLLNAQPFTELASFEKTLLSVCANDLISGQDFMRSLPR